MITSSAQSRSLLAAPCAEQAIKAGLPAAAGAAQDRQVMVSFTVVATRV